MNRKDLLLISLFYAAVCFVASSLFQVFSDTQIPHATQISLVVFFLYLVSLISAWQLPIEEKPIKILFLVTLQMLFFLGLEVYLFYGLKEPTDGIFCLMQYLALLVVQTVFLVKKF